MSLTDEEKLKRLESRLEHQNQGLLPKIAKGGHIYYVKRYSNHTIYDDEGNAIGKVKVNVGAQTRKSLKNIKKNMVNNLKGKGYEWTGDSFDFIDNFKTMLLDYTSNGESENKVNYEVFLNSHGWDEDAINRILINDNLDWFIDYFTDKLISQERSTARYQSDILRRIDDEEYFEDEEEIYY